MGPVTYAQHLISGPRLPFTASYFGSIALTLYFSLGVSLLSSTLLTPTTSSQSSADHLPRVAWKQDPHLGCLSSPTNLFDMVSCQLLSHGLQRTAACNNIWSTESSGMDDWVKNDITFLRYIFSEARRVLRSVKYNDIDHI